MNHVPNSSTASETFTLSSATLARLVENHHYSLIGDIVLFGIRAGKLEKGEYGMWLTDAVISENSLDGENLHCLLGLWNLQTHKIALFPASTVPNRYWQEKQMEDPSKQIANCLGTGAYNYIVGAHEPCNRAFEEGAFRLSRLQPVLAWRFYEPNHQYEFTNGIPTLSVVNDHIHSAQSTTKPTNISFSSAGCQVVEGDHVPPNMPTGWYQTFRILSGQSAMPSPLEVGIEYRYLLAHVNDLAKIAHGEMGTKLQQGSTGINVRFLQEALMKTGDLNEDLIDKGFFNGYTAEALYHFQKREGLPATGIASERDLKKLGVSIIN